MTWGRALAGLLVAGFAGSAGAAERAGLFAGEVDALVVGIDDYQTVNKLQGAVADARDIADALRRGGAKTVRLLVDREADRDTVLRTWDEMLATATPGSTLFLSYAGHGSQAPERVKGSEPTGKDSILVLADFAPTGRGTHQKIIDDEIGEMLDKAKAFKVIFVADACHSGTMTRGFDPRAGRPIVRAATFGAIDDDPLVLPNPAAAAIQLSDLKHVTYFGAVPDTEEAPEIDIDGASRGALSWSIARALEGAADANGDGVTTEEELERFVRENVRMKVDGQQHPQVTRGGDLMAPVLPIGQTQPAAAAPMATAGGDPLPLTIIGNGDAAALMARLTGVRPADAGTAGRFIWDVGRDEVIDAIGDVVARLNAGAGPAQVQGVVDKWRLLRSLERDAERRSLEVRLAPSDHVHHPGEQVTLSVGGHGYPYFTVFDLASDGTVNFLYPVQVGQTRDALDVPLGKAYDLTIEATPPFGADHIVAIASAAPLPALHAALKEMEGTPSAPKLGALLASHLRGQTYQLGIHGVYTAPR